jgi:glycerophosphoryl diester phosphodiesterase
MSNFTSPPAELGVYLRLIIAHRGASAYAPENTLAAFELAQRMGATEIELDVRFSRDRQIVVCHDRVLTRFGYPDLAISDLTLNELLELDMGSWFAGWLRAVSCPELPQTRTCIFDAYGSSDHGLAA